MESNYKEKIIEKYSGGGEVNRAERTGQYGMEFIYTKRALDEYIDKDKQVIEIGCGGGYYLMHYTDIFFFTMPEEMIEDTEKEGLQRIKMLGVDFLVLEEEIEGFTEEQRRIWFQFAETVVGSEYATALCNHALFICRKSL